MWDAGYYFPENTYKAFGHRKGTVKEYIQLQDKRKSKKPQKGELEPFVRAASVTTSLTTIPHRIKLFECIVTIVNPQQTRFILALHFHLQLGAYYHFKNFPTPGGNRKWGAGSKCSPPLVAAKAWIWSEEESRQVLWLMPAICRSRNERRARLAS